MIRSPFGMVICAGPSGTSKTTTLYASLVLRRLIKRGIEAFRIPTTSALDGQR